MSARTRRYSSICRRVHTATIAPTSTGCRSTRTRSHTASTRGPAGDPIRARRDSAPMIVATVVIPTHDHADTLTRAVASVQAQTLADFELFVVGDGAPS